MANSTFCSSERHLTGGGTFLLGRAEELAPGLCAQYGGKVQLIYLDPPFGTGDTFAFADDGGKRITAYKDTLQQGQYLEMMRAVLLACHELLSPTGCIYLHIDHRMSAHLRLMLDDIFGPENFVNEIIWAYKSGGRATRHFSRKHDNILLYRKSRNMFFDISAVGVPRGPNRRNHMKRTVDAAGRVTYSITSGGKTYTYHEDTPVYPSDVWDDIEHLHQRDPERTGYATQKPTELLKRIILASSRRGDLVIDLFSGSGTTCDVACRLQRPWVAVDSSAVALLALRQRMLKSHGELSLLFGGEPMELGYHQPLPVASGSAARILRSGSTTLATLTACAGGQPPRYMALGSVENGVFCPQAYELAPRLNSTLSASVQGRPVLQLAYADGSTQFLGQG